MEGRDDTDRRALEALYLAHERGLYNAAYRYVWNRDDARDIVHDAFVRMWNKRDALDWDRAAGLAYRTVLGMAANRRRAAFVRGLFGHRHDAAAGDERPAEGVADALLDEARLDAKVRSCIDALPERLRSVLVMCMFSEMDYAQIGAALGVPAGTVGSRRNDAIAKIRAMLEETGHG